MQLASSGVLRRVGPTMSSEQPTLVAAAIITNGRRVLVAQRSRFARMPGAWEFPGGKIEPHETPEQCLVRELQEELGICVRVLERFAENTYTYDHGTFTVIAFLVSWVSGQIEARIHENITWIKIDELSQYNLLAADVPIATALASMTLSKQPYTTHAAGD